MRTDQKDADFMLDFLATARDITFRNLNGIRAA
jgi:LysR family transcriptional regulator for metE and metH